MPDKPLHPNHAALNKMIDVVLAHRPSTTSKGTDKPASAKRAAKRRTKKSSPHK